jgi:hypothetical protein
MLVSGSGRGRSSSTNKGGPRIFVKPGHTAKLKSNSKKISRQDAILTKESKTEAWASAQATGMLDPPLSTKISEVLNVAHRGGWLQHNAGVGHRS